MREQYGSDRMTEKLAMALGWFGIALGVAELVAPRQVARLIGATPHERTTKALRAYGAREIASGIGILAEPTEAKWLWSRVGGDAIDLAALGMAAADDSTHHRRLSLATAAVMGVTVLDILCAWRLSAAEDIDGFQSPLGDEQAITVRAPLEQAELAWVDWCSSGHSKLKSDYAVRFEPAPGARGTEVHLAGGGRKGVIREELRRFKQLLETGEIALSDGPSLWRPAQPAVDPDVVKTIAGVL